MKLRVLLAIIILVGVAKEAQAELILLNSTFSGVIDIETRLTGLGHTVTVSDPLTWGSSFDYSQYDVVALKFGGSVNPADIGNLVSTVDNGEVGVLFFRGNGAIATSIALGLFTTTASPDYVTPADLTVTNNTHEITQNLSLGPQNLGFTFMSDYGPVGSGANTSVLAVTDAGNPALIVHNSRRVAALPFYGHSSGFGDETADSITLTNNAITWANGASAVPEPTTLFTFSCVIGAITYSRRRRV